MKQRCVIIFMFVRLKAKSYHLVKIGMCEIFIGFVKRQCLRIDSYLFRGQKLHWSAGNYG